MDLTNLFFRQIVDPVLLLVFIICLFCSIAGAKPEPVIRAMFDLCIAVVRAMSELLITIVHAAFGKIDETRRRKQPVDTKNL